MDFLSVEWVAALDAAVHGAEDDIDGIDVVELTIEHEVPGVRRWRFVLAGGSVRVLDTTDRDDLPPADVRFTCDRTTAADVAFGRRAATEAFMAGDLRLGGDNQLLLEHHRVLAGLDERLTAVRDATEPC